MNAHRFFGSIWDTAPATWPITPEQLKAAEDAVRNELAELAQASVESIGSDDSDDSAESDDPDYEIEEEELSD